MTSTELNFVLKLGAGEPPRDVMKVISTIPTYTLNRTEWRGKEARSCAVTRVSSRPHTSGDTNPIIVDVEVTYRPKGFISYTGNTKYDGWTAMVLDRAADGTLLDGNGQPLKDGEPPVYMPKEVCDDIDFNALDFGEFIDEVEVGGVPRTTEEAVFRELQSGQLSTSMQGSFIAPHRSRPLKKIILSNHPTGEAVDGFGTRILNINLSTPRFEDVLMEQLSTLMCEFIEGKASIKTIENGNVAFVQLSDALVDCEPNEYGYESWFDMMHAYTPIGFLEDLAKRLSSIYEIQVAVVPGKGGGLVLRPDGKSE